MGFDVRAELDRRRGDGPELYARYLNPQQLRTLHTIGFDKVYERAEGAYLYDRDGNRYADFLSGFGVFGVGRNHPVVRASVQNVLDAQLADLVQFDTPLLAGLLAEKLVAKAPGLDRVHFVNSGSEAVEAALKFARYATGRPRILYCDHAFHGLTVGGLSLNGAQEFRRGFDPLLPDTKIPFGDLAALEAELRKGGVAALMVEPIQGKGVWMLPDGFLAAASALLHEHGALLICDEVQTGLGRTGRWFAYQHEDVQPDIVCVAKILSGGLVPVGATLARNWIFQKVYSSMDRMMVNITTFGENAAAMAAGLAALSVLEDEDLLGNAEKTGNALRDELAAMVGQFEMLAEVRGRGLMIGIEFGRPESLKLLTGWTVLSRARIGLFSQMVVVALFQRYRILTQVAGDNMEVIKLIPPLTIGEEEVRLFVDSFRQVMTDAHKGAGLMVDFSRTMLKQAVTR